MSQATIPLMAFHAAGQYFVLDVMRVRELVRSMPLVPSPGAAPWLLGHMVLRGEVLPVLSLHLALTLGLRAMDHPGRGLGGNPDLGAWWGQGPRPNQIVVLDVAGHSLGLLVDQVSEVLRLPCEALRPDLGPEALRSKVSFGLCDVRGVAHIMLDVRPLLALTAASSAHLGGDA